MMAMKAAGMEGVTATATTTAGMVGMRALVMERATATQLEGMTATATATAAMVGVTATVMDNTTAMQWR